MSLLIALLGYGLTFWAWLLPGPLGIGDFTLLAVVAVLVGSVGRIPVGMLTDRYGARVLLPAIGVCTGLSVLALAVVDAAPVLGVLAVVTGVAGTTFAAGSALVVRAYPPTQRGMALTVFGAGMGIAAALALVGRHLVTADRRHGLLVMALALVGYAALAAAVIRDRVGPRAAAPYGRIGLGALRLPATRYLSAWYAIAFGGLLALGLSLPGYLHDVYGLEANQAVGFTTVCLTVAGASRPVGGWLCRGHDPVPVLGICFVASAVLALVTAFEPPFAIAAVPVLVGLAASLGLASGVVQATVATTVPPEHAGLIIGTVGAVGGLAGVVPPLLLAAVNGVSDSYDIGLTILAGASLAGAAKLHLDRRWIGASTAFPTASGPEQTATTVVALAATPGAAHTARLIGPLVSLATSHELVIVSVAPDRFRGDFDGYPLVTGLRLHLPRHRMVVVVVGANPRPHEVALVADLLEDGALPVVLTTATDPGSAALTLAAAVNADHVLYLAHDHVDAILRRPPWAATGTSTVTVR